MFLLDVCNLKSYNNLIKSYNLNLKKMNDEPYIALFFNGKTIISFKNYRSFFFERYYGVIE